MSAKPGECSDEIGIWYPVYTVPSLTNRSSFRNAYTPHRRNLPFIAFPAIYTHAYVYAYYLMYTSSRVAISLMALHIYIFIYTPHAHTHAHIYRYHPRMPPLPTSFGLRLNDVS